MLNRLKVMWDCIFIYTHWALSSKKLLKKIQLTCGPCSHMCDPCAPMCGPCPSMWELIMNYEKTKSELEMN